MDTPGLATVQCCVSPLEDNSLPLQPMTASAEKGESPLEAGLRELHFVTKSGKGIRERFFPDFLNRKS